ncbi:hypothetical protein [Miltoncostaea oceani]|uniref:hypothetical protein n=1 Tax=Miltoncostaea oceani TaxID=2843216 RepID=UPI001C3D69DD|nr:hypothetical protein [Miltoncostaea oceani]
MTFISTTAFTGLGALAAAVVIQSVLRSAGGLYGVYFGVTVVAFVAPILALLGLHTPVDIPLGLTLIAALAGAMILALLLVQPLYLLAHSIPPVRRRLDRRMEAKGFRRHPSGGWIREAPRR